jgi:hypothetical protein
LQSHPGKFYKSNEYLRLRKLSENDEVVSISDVYMSHGGDSIEEIYESGVFKAKLSGSAS